MSATPKRTRWQEALEQSLASALPEFLPGQRWFGSKARRIASARVEDTVWLRGGMEPCALVVAQVTYVTGLPERYVLLVALRRDPGDAPRLGTLTVAGQTRHAVEGAVDGSGSVPLLRHFTSENELAATHGGVLRFGDVPADGAGALDPGKLSRSRVRSLGAEQSNTSLRVDPGHVFKLFRRVEAGESPEVEIGRFLTTRTSFRAIAALRGSVSWLPADGAQGTVGALQDRVENQGDGWKWALNRLQAVLAGTEGPGPLMEQILGLGVTTAELHAALASGRDVPGFSPEPATPNDLRDWEVDARARAARVLDMLEAGMDRWDPRTRELCEDLLRLRGRFDSSSGLAAPSGSAGFVKIRVHGDYHLGQTLKVPGGFVVIDFEGEPARSMRERKQLHCASKDVAGMLRSFDYAIESARAPAPGGGSVEAPPLREAFLRGYETRASELGATFLPSDPDARARAVRFFELDKALYEMEYEIQNRPAWLHIPATGILRLAREMVS